MALTDSKASRPRGKKHENQRSRFDLCDMGKDTPNSPDPTRTTGLAAEKDSMDEETIDAYTKRMDRIVTYLSFKVYQTNDELRVLTNGLRDVWQFIRIFINEAVATSNLVSGSALAECIAAVNALAARAIPPHIENQAQARDQGSIGYKTDMIAISNDHSTPSSEGFTDRRKTPFYAICSEPEHAVNDCKGDGARTRIEQLNGETTGLKTNDYPNCEYGVHWVEDCSALRGGMECQRPSNSYQYPITCSNCKNRGHHFMNCWFPGGEMHGQKPKRGEINIQNGIPCSNCFHSGHVVETCWAGGGGKAGQGLQKKYMSHDRKCGNCNLKGHTFEECWALGGPMEGQVSQEADLGRGLTCSNCRRHGHSVKTCEENDSRKGNQGTKKIYVSRAGLSCTNCKRDGHIIDTCWMSGGGLEGQGPPRVTIRHGGPVCRNCKREGHTHSTCWGNGGGLEGLVPRRPKKNHNIISTNNDSTTVDSTLLCSFGTTKADNIFDPVRNRIIIDSGCTNHVTWRKDLFVTYTALKPGEKRIALVDGRLLDVDGVGTIALPLRIGNGNPDSPGTMVEFKDVIHFKSASTTILSLSQLSEGDIRVKFIEGMGFFLRSRSTNVVVGKAVLADRLYVLLVHSQNHGAASTSSASHPTQS